MDKKASEIVQVVIFLIIFAGQVFLASRYYPRGDTVGTIIFAVVAVLALVAAIGHLIEFKKLR